MNDPSTNIVLPALPAELKELRKIALNLWWTWNPRGKNLFKLLNAYRWKESGHNPILMLRSLSEKEFRHAIENAFFMREYHYVAAQFGHYMAGKSVMAEKAPTVAYFCAEFGLHRSLPIYSGGLGFLAGDILKESSDMGLSMVGVGFMYPQGYNYQVIGSDGWQQDRNQPIDKDAAPVERILDEKGEHLVVEVPFIDPPIAVSVWKINVGRTTLYLLDTDIDQNDPWDREVSSKLYTPDMHQRLRQEIVLGVGGYRVLEVLSIKYSVLHLNEGHSAFALLERIRVRVESGMEPDAAIEEVKQCSVFTTHTPLQAATDVYGFEMIEQYFADYWEKLGIGKEQFLSLGVNPDEPSAGFNMTVLGLNMCHYRNGVSQIHAETSRTIWASLFPKTPLEKIPITHITNGVHLPTWLNDELHSQYTRLFGNEWLNIQDNPDLWQCMDELDNETLWNLHRRYKLRLINILREQVRRKYADEGIDPVVALAEGLLLDPDILTIGFARRITTYKRPDLILHDLQRLEKMIDNEDRPIQIVFAGKAHPSDNSGKQILQRIFKIAQDPRFKGRIAFVEDYGEFLAKYLVCGVDVWLNSPLPPMEACGTSGMKSSMNGVLHLSIMDGWWPEGFNNRNGWRFGAQNGDDAEDAGSLYDTLENEIVPLYYDSGDEGIPHGWIAMMKAAMQSISPHFGARRMMNDYIEKFYLPISQKIGEKKR